MKRRFRVSGFRSQVSRFASVVVLVAVALCLGCTTDKADEKGTKVLMIGNSFSICCLKHLPQVAADRGVDLDLASLYIGGCSLKRHWENALKDGDSDFKPYLYGRNRFGKFSQSKANVCEVLRSAKWDVVTIQQASHDSWKPATYHPYGDNLVAKIRELAPQAKIVVQETWSYTPWDKRLKGWGIDQDEMYGKLHDAYGAFAKQYDFEVIPFGAAVQEWRRRLPVRYTERSFGGDVVGGRGQSDADDFKRDMNGVWTPNGDVFHLNEKGEYFQALVWAVKLFDVDLTELEYKPDFVTDDEAKLMKEIAMGLK